MQKILLVLTVSWFSWTDGVLCPTKDYSLLDRESNDHMSCPGPNDPPNWTECCGPSWMRRCCPFEIDQETIKIREEARRKSRFFDDDDDDYWDHDTDELFEGVAKFIGIAVGLTAFFIVCTILCCCCAPCCFFAKRRRVTRGVIHNPPQAATTGNGPYPVQMTQTNTNYPPQPSQPPQPYSDLPPPYPGPPAGGWSAPAYDQGGYPPAPGVQAPMMTTEYTQKQPAFNPNMQ